MPKSIGYGSHRKAVCERFQESRPGGVITTPPCASHYNTRFTPGAECLQAKKSEENRGNGQLLKEESFAELVAPHERF
jgi:hypothetical protein